MEGRSVTVKLGEVLSNEANLLKRGISIEVGKVRILKEILCVLLMQKD